MELLKKIIAMYKNSLSKLTRASENCVAFPVSTGVIIKKSFPTAAVSHVLSSSTPSIFIVSEVFVMGSW